MVQFRWAGFNLRLATTKHGVESGGSATAASHAFAVVKQNNFLCLSLLLILDQLPYTFAALSNFEASVDGLLSSLSDDSGQVLLGSSLYFHFRYSKKRFVVIGQGEYII